MNLSKILPLKTELIPTNTIIISIIPIFGLLKLKEFLIDSLTRPLMSSIPVVPKESMPGVLMLFDNIDLTKGTMNPSTDIKYRTALITNSL